MRHVISYEESRDFPIKSILKHERRPIHTFLLYRFQPTDVSHFNLHTNNKNKKKNNKLSAIMSDVM